MSLASGTRLGPYEIVARLGSGGMGDVYKARDSRLGRFVALKTLRPELAGSAIARERFEREAHAISKLSHPHVCAIHDVGQTDGTSFLVMELLDGEPLSQRIAKGPIAMADLLAFGIQIAEALAAAHRRGLVHRDLKPANVMITSAGVKLLDFGLAKALEPAVDAAGGAGDLATTAITELTGKGVWIGTAPYMAPEQIQGKPAELPADIFALGAVLYEMATGQRAFPGPTLPEIASAILHHEPAPPSFFRAELPPPFDRLVRDCLVKDPDRRWQNAHDVALQLATIQESIADDARRPGTKATRQPSRSSTLAWTVAAAAVALAFATWWQRPSGAPLPVRTELQILPPPNGSFAPPFETVTFSPSPDGSRLAFVAADPVSPRRIWVRPLLSVEGTPVPGTDGAVSVFWSPDSKSIGFFADGALKRLDLASGAAVTICSVPKNVGLTGAWSQDGHVLFSSIQGEAIYRVNTAGGEPSAQVTPDRSKNEIRTALPSVLPDGHRYLYQLQMADNSRWLMMGDTSTPGAAALRVMPMSSEAEYVNGTLVFERGGALVGQRFDPDSGKVVGDSYAVAKSVRFNAPTGIAVFATSASGAIVLQADRDRSRVAWLDRAGLESEAIDAPGEYLDVRLASSSQGPIALVSRILPSTGSFDIWQFDLTRRTQTRLTQDDLVTEISPLLLSDQTTLIFAAARGGPPRLMRKNLTTGTEEPMVPPGRALQGADDVTPDGRLLAYEERTERGNYNFWTLPLAGGAPTVLRESASNDVDLRFSPDGHYYSYTSNESGRLEVYVSPVADRAKTAVSNGGAGLARWSRDGKELFYLTGDRRFVTVPVRTNPRLELGTPTTLFALGAKGWVDFDVAADGKRFLAIVREITGNDQPLTALMNAYR